MSVRMQIYLTRKLYRKLKELSRSSGKPMAEHIRDSLSKYLENEKQAKAYPGDPIWEIAGKGHSDAKDLSSDHDNYLYAREKDETD